MQSAGEWCSVYLREKSENRWASTKCATTLYFLSFLLREFSHYVGWTARLVGSIASLVVELVEPGFILPRPDANKTFNKANYDTRILSKERNLHPTPPMTDFRERQQKGGRAMSAPTILICEDHALFGDTLESYLAAQGMDVVGRARSGSEAVEMASALRPDAILMDLEMPVMGGVEATRLIKSRDPELRIIALTAYSEVELISDAVKAGVDGYILKTVTANEFREIIGLFLEGESAFDRSVAVRLIRAATGEGAGVPGPAAAIAALMPRQREILVLLADGQTNREIAVRLSLSGNTVKHHVTGILGTVGVRNRTQAAVMLNRASPAGERGPDISRFRRG